MSDVADRINQRREGTGRRHGRKTPNKSRLTAEDVARMKAMWESGRHTAAQIGEEFHLSVEYARDIATGKRTVSCRASASP